MGYEIFLENLFAYKHAFAEEAADEICQVCSFLTVPGKAVVFKQNLQLFVFIYVVFD